MTLQLPFPQDNIEIRNSSEFVRAPRFSTDPRETRQVGTPVIPLVHRSRGQFVVTGGRHVISAISAPALHIPVYVRDTLQSTIMTIRWPIPSFTTKRCTLSQLSRSRSHRDGPLLRLLRGACLLTTASGSSPTAGSDAGSGCPVS